MAGLLSDVLPYIYSRGDALSRQVGDFASNPLASVQQTLGFLNDNMQAQGRLLSQAFQDPQRPFKITSQEALDAATTSVLSGLLGFAPLGMIAYHGSPAVFDRFSKEKIGSGRGLEQGWGVYLTDAERVAQENGQNVYKVDVPDEAVSRMLEWQSPIKQQPKDVRKAVARAIGKEAYKDSVRYGATGSDVYNGWLAGLSPREASELLSRSGVPGIRYGGNGTTNTVVFDPDIANIIHR